MNQQHSILNEVLKQGISLQEQAFRTPSANPEFSHNIFENEITGVVLQKATLRPF